MKKSNKIFKAGSQQSQTTGLAFGPRRVPQRVYYVERSDGSKHVVKRGDQFKCPLGYTYQVCTYKGRLKLWQAPVHPKELDEAERQPLDSTISFPLSHIKTKNLSLIENLKEEARYSERFIHEKLYKKEYKAYTGIQLDKETKECYEKLINERYLKEKEDKEIEKKIKQANYTFYNGNKGR